MDKRKHRRCIKRLTVKFFIDHKSFTGILSDLSEAGIFIRTNRGLAVDTHVGIELFLPNNRVSFLRGIVRRSIRTPISSVKNGMGIELSEKDETFTDFVRSIIGKNETNIEGNNDPPVLRTISFSSYKSPKLDPRIINNERRRNKRLNVKNIKVNGEMPSAKEVKILDISISGVLMKADRRLNIGRRYALKIGYKDKVLFVEAAVVWSLLVESLEGGDGNIKPVYLAGMQFTDGSNEKIEEVINLVEVDAQTDMSPFSEAGEKHAEFIRSENSDFPLGCSVKEGEAEFPDVAPEEISGGSETEASAEFIKRIESIYRKYEKKCLTYYGILDAGDFADSKEIKKAYYKRAKELHPDRYSYLSHEMKEKLNFIFAYLTEAYKTLMDPGSKEKYDRSLITEKRVSVSNQELAHQEFERGKLEFWNGNLLTAERFFQNAVYLDNSSGKYFFFFAKTLQKLGRPREAEKAIKKALIIDHQNADYLVEAGYIYNALGLSNRARESFETALRFQPTNIKAHEGITGVKSKKDNGGLRYNIYNSIKAFKKMV